MVKHKFIPGTITRIRNRCWACGEGGTVHIYKIVDDIKDSSRAVHFNEKCMNAAKEKYKTFSTGKVMTAASKG